MKEGKRGWGEADEVIKPGTKSERRSGTQGGRRREQRHRHPRDKSPEIAARLF